MAFFNDISLGHYYPGVSYIHRLDPRTKLIAVFLLMISFLFTYNLLLLLACVFFAAAIVLATNIPISIIMRNLRPFIWLFLLTLIVHLFWTPGGHSWTLPKIGLRMTDTGLAMGLAFSIRLALLIVIAATLTLSTSPVELTDALDKLLSPLQKIRVPIHEIIMMLTLSLRFIPTLMDEVIRIKNAQLSRGASFEGNLVKRFNSIIPLVLPLFISAFRRADELAYAMDSRCYAIGNPRSHYKKLAFSSADYIALTICILFVGATIWFVFRP
jgi:energy-coupling factor transport system permease protein